MSGASEADVPLMRSIVTPEGVRFEPWTDSYAVGFRVTHPDGRVEFIYLNPSQEVTQGSDVFVYHGTAGDPALDAPMHYYPLFEEQE